MITNHQAAELRRRIETALLGAWDAGCNKDKDDAQHFGDMAASAEQRVFRYIDHLAGKRRKR